MKTPLQRSVAGFLLFVIPAGFEPTTDSLEGCCSIQLSYGTIPMRRKPTLRRCKSNNFSSEKQTPD